MKIPATGVLCACKLSDDVLVTAGLSGVEFIKRTSGFLLRAYTTG